MQNMKPKYVLLTALGFIQVLVMMWGGCSPINSSMQKSALQNTDSNVLPKSQTVTPIHIFRVRAQLLAPDSYEQKLNQMSIQKPLNFNAQDKVFDDFKSTGKAEFRVESTTQPNALSANSLPDDALIMFKLDSNSALTPEELDLFDASLKPQPGNTVWVLSVSDSVPAELSKKVLSHLVEVSIVFNKGGVTFTSPNTSASRGAAAQRNVSSKLQPNQKSNEVKKK